VIAEEFDFRLLAEADDVEEADVIAFWEREGAMSSEVAAERVKEVAFVATTPDGEIAGISTVFLRWTPQLRTEMWHLREFVGAEHRHSQVARRLMRETRVHVEELFASGKETRAPGILGEIENESVKKGWPLAVWEHPVSPGKRWFFLGENAKGDHLRVLFFDGARAPLPHGGPDA
jgi:hypothetical protein